MLNFLAPVFGFAMKNPWKVGLALALVVLGFYVWRTDALKDKIAAFTMAIVGYEKAVDILQKDSQNRDEISHLDKIDSVRNERTKSEILRRIEERKDNEEKPVDPIIRDSIGWLYAAPRAAAGGQDRPAAANYGMRRPPGISGG